MRLELAYMAEIEQAKFDRIKYEAEEEAELASRFQKKVGYALGAHRVKMKKFNEAKKNDPQLQLAEKAQEDQINALTTVRWWIEPTKRDILPLYLELPFTLDTLEQRGFTVNYLCQYRSKEGVLAVSRRPWAAVPDTHRTKARIRTELHNTSVLPVAPLQDIVVSYLMDTYVYMLASLYHQEDDLRVLEVSGYVEGTKPDFPPLNTPAELSLILNAPFVPPKQ